MQINIIILVIVRIIILTDILTNNPDNSTINSVGSVKNANNDKKDSADLEYTQGKVNPDDVPSDIYSRWDTDWDGIISSSESDVHDRDLGQGNYYIGHENMKDSVTTYPWIDIIELSL